jgi:hypothetical protein
MNTQARILIVENGALIAQGLKQILAELDKLEQQHATYAPIFKVLRQFAKNYQFDRIIELLEKRSGANGT